jgi:hypothetical protein
VGLGLDDRQGLGVVVGLDGDEWGLRLPGAVAGDAGGGIL